MKYRLVERISPKRLGVCLNQLAQSINRDYSGKSLVLIGILKGAFIFMADLARRLSIPVQLDFVRLPVTGKKPRRAVPFELQKTLSFPSKGNMSWWWKISSIPGSLSVGIWSI